MINFELRKNILCSDAEKESCLEAIDEIISLANLARARGILALEERAEKLEEGLLKTGLMLIVDGTETNLVSRIMEIAITASPTTGAALLRQLIVYEGLLSIQAGENPRIITLKLRSFLGEDYLKDHKSRTETSTSACDTKKTVPQYGSSISAVPDFDVLQALDDRSLQQVLRETDKRELTVALKGATEETREKIFSNLSIRFAEMIKEEMLYIGSLRASDVEKAQHGIIKIMQALQEAGEIVVEKR